MNSNTNNINITTGIVRLTVNHDESKIISFDPTDLIFAEKFYRLIAQLEKQLHDFRVRSIAIEANKTLDENDVPVNIKERLDLLRDTCQFLREKIDDVFGENTSQNAFGTAMNLDMFAQFIDQITPYVKDNRATRVNKYMSAPVKSRASKKAKRIRK